MLKMAPFIMLVTSAILFRFLGWIGVPYLDAWNISLRFAMAMMLLLTASAHWGQKRNDLIQMVPPIFPKPAAFVSLTGWLEIIGAICLVIPSTAKVASIGLFILFLFMFPANVYAARKKLYLGNKPVTPLGLRIIFQIVFLVIVLLAGWLPY